MYRPVVFISHHTSERENAWASKVHDVLSAAGADVWVDLVRLQAGFLATTINDALEHCDWFVLILTPDATVAQSYVRKEVDAALDLAQDGKLRMVFLVCEPVQRIPPLWRQVHRIEAVQDFERALDELKALTWEYTVPDSLPIGRGFHATASLSGGRFLVAGGVTGGITRPSYTRDALIFDAASAAWSTAGQLQFPRAQAAAVPLDGERALLIGGVVGTVPSPVAEVFDRRASTFSRYPTAFSPLYGHTASQLGDGRIVVAGGSDGNAMLRTVHVLDPRSNGLTQDAPLGFAAMGHAAVVLPNDNLVLLGGDRGQGADDWTEMYGLGSGIIGGGPRLRVPRRDHAAMWVADTDQIVVAGGRNHSGPLASVEILDLKRRHSELGPNLGVPRYGLCMVAVDSDTALLIGGLGPDGDALTLVEVFDIKNMVFKQSYRIPTRTLGFH